MMPSYFIAHGAPFLAIEQNEYTDFLSHLGRTLPRPKAVVLFSAHWETSTHIVSDVDTFETIHDFGGFPDELYQIHYPAKGDKRVTDHIKELLIKHNIPFDVDMTRGLDHGAWVVLRLIYPEADVPVISMSVNPNLTPEEQYKVGESLTALRKQDILIIASGGTVHNLSTLKMGGDGSEVDDWAREFDEWLEEKLLAWDLESLFRYKHLAPSAELAVPQNRDEHFIPLFYAMGAANNARNAKLLHRSYRYGNLSHSVWQFGL